MACFTSSLTAGHSGKRTSPTTANGQQSASKQTNHVGIRHKQRDHGLLQCETVRDAGERVHVAGQTNAQLWLGERVPAKGDAADSDALYNEYDPTPCLPQRVYAVRSKSLNAQRHSHVSRRR
jgi:hypothetical protein